MLVVVFEGEFGNAGFVEVVQACGDHAVVFFLVAPADSRSF